MLLRKIVFEKIHIVVDYFLTDHLGSVRVNVDADGTGLLEHE